jgi:hypothetical protein
MRDSLKTASEIFFEAGTFTDWIAIFLNALTLLIAWLVYRKFASKHVVTKQVEQVCQIIKDLHESTFSMMIVTFETNGTYYVSRWHSVFEFAKLESAELDSYLMLTLEPSELPLGFVEHISNPFTPIEVVKQIKRFQFSRNASYTYGSLLANRQSFVLINGAPSLHPDMKFYGPTCEALMNWKNLRTCSKDLRTEIIEWLKLNNIENINI